MNAPDISKPHANLINTGSSLPGGANLPSIMEAALSMARRIGVGSDEKLRPIGINMLLQAENGTVFDGDFNPARLMETDGREWGERTLRAWMTEHKVVRAAFYRDFYHLHEQTAELAAKKFIVMGMDDTQCLIHTFEFKQLLEQTKPEPLACADYKGAWYQAFKFNRGLIVTAGQPKGT